MTFTYLLGWSKKDKWYYGVRYSNDYIPNDSWIIYFTTSYRVKEFLILNGEPDIIQIRKTFVSRSEANAWKTKVLRRIKAESSYKWLMDLKPLQ